MITNPKSLIFFSSSNSCLPQSLPHPHTLTLSHSHTHSHPCIIAAGHSPICSHASLPQPSRLAPSMCLHRTTSFSLFSFSFSFSFFSGFISSQSCELFSLIFGGLIRWWRNGSRLWYYGATKIFLWVF